MFNKNRKVIRIAQATRFIASSLAINCLVGATSVYSMDNWGSESDDFSASSDHSLIYDDSHTEKVLEEYLKQNNSLMTDRLKRTKEFSCLIHQYTDLMIDAINKGDEDSVEFYKEEIANLETERDAKNLLAVNKSDQTTRKCKNQLAIIKDKADAKLQQQRNQIDQYGEAQELRRQEEKDKLDIYIHRLNRQSSEEGDYQFKQQRSSIRSDSHFDKKPTPRSDHKVKLLKLTDVDLKGNLNKKSAPPLDLDIAFKNIIARTQSKGNLDKKSTPSSDVKNNNPDNSFFIKF